jgi:hypothetical protein
MSELHSVTYHQALEILESLPEEQQDQLIQTIKRRRIEQRREFLSEGIREAKAEYQRGEVRRGPVEDLLRELEE